MRKFIITMASAAALATSPVMLGNDVAQAGSNDIIKGIIGGIIASAVINSIVQSGQYHCHGRACHSHGYAEAGHYHDAYGRILYQYQAPPRVYVAPPPPPPPPAVYGAYSQAHYNWCAAKYRSYDAGSNTYQPYGYVPRRACISPYM